MRRVVGGGDQSQKKFEQKEKGRKKMEMRAGKNEKTRKGKLKTLTERGPDKEFLDSEPGGRKENKTSPGKKYQEKKQKGMKR